MVYIVNKLLKLFIFGYIFFTAIEYFDLTTLTKSETQTSKLNSVAIHRHIKVLKK